MAANRIVHTKPLWVAGLDPDDVEDAGRARSNFDILAKEAGVVDEAIHWNNNVKQGQPARRVRHVRNTVRKGGFDGRRGLSVRGNGAGDRAWANLGVRATERGTDPRPLPGDQAHPPVEALSLRFAAILKGGGDVYPATGSS